MAWRITRDGRVGALIFVCPEWDGLRTGLHTEATCSGVGELNDHPALRKKNVEQLLFDLVEDDGGPLIYHCDSEEQQSSFDSTCRKFHRFFASSQR